MKKKPLPSFNQLFQDPDHVGQSEYWAIYETVHDGAEIVDPDKPLDREQFNQILGILGEFEAVARCYLRDIVNRGYTHV